MAAVSSSATGPPERTSMRARLGVPVGAAWRAAVIARVAELRSLAEWLRAERKDGGRVGDQAYETAMEHLDAASAAARADETRWLAGRQRAWLTGADLERA